MVCYISEKKDQGHDSEDQQKAKKILVLAKPRKGLTFGPFS